MSWWLTRLIDGIEPFLIASSVEMIIAQRLFVGFVSIAPSYGASTDVAANSLHWVSILQK